jgi:hypothetical protein
MTPRRIKPNKVRGRQFEEVREVDPDGRIVVHHRLVDTLGRMLKSGTIDQAMHDAGREFERAFAAAGLDPLQARSLERLPGNPSSASSAERMLDARRGVNMAMAVLGGHASCAGSCVWFVLGHQLSLRQWSLRQRWGGRAIRPDQATGVAVAALSVLAAHFGYCAGERCAWRREPLP